MGNHEFNAISFATPNPEIPGEFMRPQGRTREVRLEESPDRAVAVVDFGMDGDAGCLQAPGGTPSRQGATIGVRNRYRDGSWSPGSGPQLRSVDGGWMCEKLAGTSWRPRGEHGVLHKTARVEAVSSPVFQARPRSPSR